MAGGVGADRAGGGGFSGGTVFVGMVAKTRKKSARYERFFICSGTTLGEIMPSLSPQSVSLSAGFAYKTL